MGEQEAQQLRAFLDQEGLRLDDVRNLLARRDENEIRNTSEQIAATMPIMSLPEIQKQTLNFFSAGNPCCFKFGSLWFAAGDLDKTVLLRLAMCKLFTVPADLAYACPNCTVVEPTLMRYLQHMERGCEASAVFDHSRPDGYFSLTTCWAHVVLPELITLLVTSPPFEDGRKDLVRVDSTSYGLGPSARHPSPFITKEVTHDKGAASRLSTGQKKLKNFVKNKMKWILLPVNRPSPTHVGRHMPLFVTMPWLKDGIHWPTDYQPPATEASLPLVNVFDLDGTGV
jgi:hypothetical protein